MPANPRFLRRSLLLSLLLVWFLAIAAVWRYYPLLDAVRLGGPAVIGLLFFPLAIFGTASEMPVGGPPQRLWRAYAKFWVVMGLILVTFCGGLWLLLVTLYWLLPAWVPDWGFSVVFIIAASWYVAALLKLYYWLAPRLR